MREHTCCFVVRVSHQNLRRRVNWSSYQRHGQHASPFVLREAAPHLVLVEASALPKIGYLGDEALGDQHVVRLQVAVDQGLATRLLVVKVPETRGDTQRDLVERVFPVVLEPVRGRGHQQVLQRAPFAELEHEAEFVRSVVPASANETDEVGVRQRSHELQLAHELAHHPSCDFRDAARLDGHRVEAEHALPYDAERPVCVCVGGSVWVSRMFCCTAHIMLLVHYGLPQHTQGI